MAKKHFKISFVLLFLVAVLSFAVFSSYHKSHPGTGDDTTPYTSNPMPTATSSFFEPYVPQTVGEFMSACTAGGHGVLEKSIAAGNSEAGYQPMDASYVSHPEQTTEVWMLYIRCFCFDTVTYHSYNNYLDDKKSFGGC